MKDNSEQELNEDQKLVYKFYDAHELIAVGIDKLFDRLSFLKKELASRDKEIEELKMAIKDLIPIAERTAITVDDIDWRLQWETKRKAIDRAKALIQQVNPQRQDKQPQPSTP